METEFKVIERTQTNNDQQAVWVTSFSAVQQVIHWETRSLRSLNVIKGTQANSDQWNKWLELRTFSAD